MRHGHRSDASRRTRLANKLFGRKAAEKRKCDHNPTMKQRQRISKMGCSPHIRTNLLSNYTPTGTALQEISYLFQQIFERIRADDQFRDAFVLRAFLGRDG